MEERKTAGELANKALQDKTTYDAMEVAYASLDDLSEQLYQAARNYSSRIEEPEYCVVMVIASDPIIHNMKRRKFYCWPWLPSPRPNQSVFLYNKIKDKITKRLWVLPCDQVMAELASSDLIVDKKYQNMQAWSVAFFKGTFWELIRYQHDIKMLSQQEYFKSHEAELLKAKLDNPDLFTPETFDFTKIGSSEVADSSNFVSS